MIRIRFQAANAKPDFVKAPNWILAERIIMRLRQDTYRDQAIKIVATDRSGYIIYSSERV